MWTRGQIGQEANPSKYSLWANLDSVVVLLPCLDQGLRLFNGPGKLNLLRNLLFVPGRLLYEAMGRGSALSGSHSRSRTMLLTAFSASW